MFFKGGTLMLESWIVSLNIPHHYYIPAHIRALENWENI